MNKLQKLGVVVSGAVLTASTAIAGPIADLTTSADVAGMHTDTVALLTAIAVFVIAFKAYSLFKRGVNRA